MNDHQLDNIVQAISQSEQRLEGKLNDLRSELKDELARVEQYLQGMSNQDIITQDGQIEQRLADVENRLP